MSSTRFSRPATMTAGRAALNPGPLESLMAHRGLNRHFPPVGCPFHPRFIVGEVYRPRYDYVPEWVLWPEERPAPHA